MGIFDRFQELSYREERERDRNPRCERCGEEVCVGLGESVYYSERDSYYCDFTCFERDMKVEDMYEDMDENEVLEELGGEWV